MTILNAAMQTCGDVGGERRWRPVRRTALGAGRAAVAGRRGRHRRRGRAVRRDATAAAPQAPANTATVRAGELSGDGLPGRDPDLPGAIGRLAVLRDQPGPRDLHQAARATATRSAAATCSTGWTTTRCCCCAARSRPTATCAAATRGKDVRQLNRNLRTLGYDGDRRLHREDRGRRSRGSSTTRASTRPERSSSATRSSCPRPVRIAKVTGELGGPARPGAPVAQATSDTLEVQVDLDASQQGEVKRGRPRADHAARQHGR